MSTSIFTCMAMFMRISLYAQSCAGMGRKLPKTVVREIVSESQQKTRKPGAVTACMALQGSFQISLCAYTVCDFGQVFTVLHSFFKLPRLSPSCIKVGCPPACLEPGCARVPASLQSLSHQVAIAAMATACFAIVRFCLLSRMAICIQVQPSPGPTILGNVDFVLKPCQKIPCFGLA